jgi:hypothetical protein
MTAQQKANKSIKGRKQERKKENSLKQSVNKRTTRKMRIHFSDPNVGGQRHHLVGQLPQSGEHHLADLLNLRQVNENRSIRLWKLSKSQLERKNRNTPAVAVLNLIVSCTQVTQVD